MGMRYSKSMLFALSYPIDLRKRTEDRFNTRDMLAVCHDAMRACAGRNNIG